MKTKMILLVLLLILVTTLSTSCRKEEKLIPPSSIQKDITLTLQQLKDMSKLDSINALPDWETISIPINGKCVTIECYIVQFGVAPDMVLLFNDDLNMPTTLIKKGLVCCSLPEVYDEIISHTTTPDLFVKCTIHGTIIEKNTAQGKDFEIHKINKIIF